jgi:hypothetical protein
VAYFNASCHFRGRSREIHGMFKEDIRYSGQFLSRAVWNSRQEL